MKKTSLLVGLFITFLSSIYPQIDTSLVSGLEYRFVGPYRGGRCTAVTGIAEQPFTFYMGATGGGVWKTDDAGNRWKSISDGQIECGSIGAVAVPNSQPQTIYVGTGSDSPRGNVSAGIGMYKSIDGGTTWNHIGLDHCGQIGDIIIHPKNPDIVYVAALGNVFKSNAERGVFKTEDGGKTWNHVLFLSDTVGAVDLEIHPENPDIIYAGMWRVERKPWTLIDGGNEGGLYKSTDAGKTWDRIINGLPEGIVGRIGIAISPVNSQRIWILTQAADEEQAGLYRSDDGGKNFKRICRDHKLRQRGWYYTRVFADPKDENTVYVTNVSFYKSIDGGKNFDHRFPVPHGDTHDLWINPKNPQIMINSNDGGATVSLNGGKTWSTQYNQPTAEFYRLTVDHQFPYRLYAGQQDNSTISVPSRNAGGTHPKEYWHAVGGGESGDIAVHPFDPNIVYAGTYSGILTRANLTTDEWVDVSVYPHYTEGTAMRDLKYRWQWNYPIRISHHDYRVIYHTSNHVHKSVNEGNQWEIISPDLTRNIKAYQDIPGGPVQHDATGVEVYSTIFAFEESPHDKNTLWAGSDDGLIHLTRDGGQTWANITPDQMPKEATVNHISLSPHNKGSALVAVYRYRRGDFSPYIFRTRDFGESWSLLTNDKNGIAKNHFVRCIVEDPIRKGLLFAGTEYGMYVSYNHGNTWQKLQLNLPHVPITDMQIHRGDLVLSTQGRGFWILDDLGIVRQLDLESPNDHIKLYKPEDTYRSDISGFSSTSEVAPPKAPFQAHIYFYMPHSMIDSNVQIQVCDAAGEIAFEKNSYAESKTQKMNIKQGMNHVVWNLKYPAPYMVKDLIMMDMRHPGIGPEAAPGRYQVRLKVGQKTLESNFEIHKDSRWLVSDQSLYKNFQLAKLVRDQISSSQKQIANLRQIKDQLNDLAERLKDLEKHPDIQKSAKVLADKSVFLEDMIYQRKIEVSQDEINYPRKYTNHIIRLYRLLTNQDIAPTPGILDRWKDLQTNYQPFVKAYRKFIDEEMIAFLRVLKEKDIPVILFED